MNFFMPLNFMTTAARTGINLFSQSMVWCKEEQKFLKFYNTIFTNIFWPSNCSLGIKLPLLFPTFFLDKGLLLSWNLTRILHSVNPLFLVGLRVLKILRRWRFCSKNWGEVMHTVGLRRWRWRGGGEGEGKHFF